MSKIGIITQARMTSTRLPGKVLLKAGNKSLLALHLERLATAGVPVFLATTVNRTDDPIVEECRRLSIPCFRGDELDVLNRFSETAREFELEHVVRVTSDCPLIDGAEIKKGIQLYLKEQSQNIYLSNCLRRTFPRGMDFEVFSAVRLFEADQEATALSDREHVTPYLNKNRSGQMILIDYLAPQDNSDLRLTVDESADFQLIEELITKFHANMLSVDRIVDLLRKHGELIRVNQHVEQKHL
ncbi:MAG: acylneuraminate cytidylyltransferase [Proteobacteria bacterium]|nr:acylneuraminate cytidylyltransferase [Pseudomonadota bacterium]NDC23934.1 acylneuraminate cytidylyltransferase [Pseudomonadota bacterium]NDD03481.1 acylneuraminate cytidylyltransferase [Pseudomonadota bacterium]NDG26293.1 acylneuraminate cytidylyltransferase [Pseudomonadota bacterium]